MAAPATTITAWSSDGCFTVAEPRRHVTWTAARLLMGAGHGRAQSCCGEWQPAARRPRRLRRARMEVGSSRAVARRCCPRRRRLRRAHPRRRWRGRGRGAGARRCRAAVVARSPASRHGAAWLRQGGRRPRRARAAMAQGGARHGARGGGRRHGRRRGGRRWRGRAAAWGRTGTATRE
jgi:hypothetical protein